MSLGARWVVGSFFFVLVAVFRVPGSESLNEIPRVTGLPNRQDPGDPAQPLIMKSTHVYVKNSADPSSQSLDLYVPAQAVPGANLPMMVYVHGGGMARGSKNNRKGHEITFPKAGFITACINYRKSDPDAEGHEKAMYPDHVEDVAAAIAWLHYNARQIGGDPNRIFLMGHSSGAALVALVATDEQFLAKFKIPLSTLKGVICNDSGFYDLMERAKRPRSRLVIENAYGSDPAVWQKASPSSHVRAGKGIPPFFLTYTTMPKEKMAEAFAHQLSSAGIPATVFSSLGRDHEEVNFAVSDPGDPLNTAVFRFLSTAASGKSSQISQPAADSPRQAGRERRRPLAAIRNVLKGIIDRT